MLSKKLYGVVVPLVTPFDKKGELDIPSLESLTEYLVQAGIQCLYPGGTTGEMMLLDIEERKILAESVVKKNAGRSRVYIHVGAMNQRDTIRLAQHAVDIGADGIGVVTPSFWKISDDALVSYYEGISKSVPKDFPVYLYAIPQCAVNDISVEAAKKIAERCSNIIGIKYSYPNMPRIIDMMTVNNGNFSVLCGPDELYHVTACAGGDGTVSGNANVIPDYYEAIYTAIEAGDFEKAKKIQKETTVLNNILSCNNNIARYKAALKEKGIIANADVRSPLVNISTEELKKMLELLDKNAWRKPCKEF